MKIYRSITVLGIIGIISGIIFHLQGQAIVGPESSFMYSNPEWVTLGLQIVVIGILLICFSVGIKILKKSKQ